jgi:pimeloyl-ACP methyl ester carboxylesterase
VFAALTATMAWGPADGATTKLVTESTLIPSADAGIQLYLREKRPADQTQFSSDRILLFVHGATYPAETAFDLPLGGISMMEWIAQRGWDVWLVDVRGYGGSTRPPEMNRPAQENQPIVDTATAARDVGSAIAHILQKRGVQRINLMGWSWGTAIMGSYTAEHNDQVAPLVLYAPAWISNAPSPPAAGDPLGAYRTVSIDSAKERWLKGVPDDKKADLISGRMVRAMGRGDLGHRSGWDKADASSAAYPQRGRPG